MVTKNKKEISLHDLLIMKLQALYDVENQLIKALPKMEKHATHPDLKMALESHLEETKNQARRLEMAFRSLGEKPKKLKSEAIRGLISDAEWLMKNVKDKNSLDAGIIAAGQYVEHYEMAGYGSAKAWAEEMGHSEAERLLTETLEEEKAADEKLNELAEGGINTMANMMDDEEEEEEYMM